MKAGDFHTIEFTSEQLGYVHMCIKQILKKDQKGGERFGEDLDLDSSLAHRIRIGGDVAWVMEKAHDLADVKGYRNENADAGQIQQAPGAKAQ